MKNKLCIKITALSFALALGFSGYANKLYAQQNENEDINEDEYIDFGSDRGLTVTGTRETTQQMRVIDKEAIERRNAKDLAALLEEELDMSVTRFGGYGNQTDMNLRGFDTERIAILIDGIPANSPRSGEFDVTQIDLNSVERIEVIYGGSDTKYNVSGALGGVINIITVKKQPPGLRFGITFSNTSYMPGEYNSRHSGGAIGEPEYKDLLDTQSLGFFAGSGGEAFSWKGSLFANRAGNHYLYMDDYGFARRKQSNEVLDGGGNAALVWNLPQDTTLLSDTKFYYAHKNFPITMNAEGSALATDLQITENIMLNAPFAFNNWAAEASVSFQTSLTRYGVNISSDDYYLTAINRWSWYPHDKFSARLGADWRFLYINSESETETNPVKTGNAGGVYITGEYSPVKEIMIIASVKGASDTKQFAAVPKLGVSWKPHDALVLKNNYFRTFKFPDFDDLYYRSMDGVFAGNPNLKPEDGWGADISGRWTPRNEDGVEILSLEAAVYGTWTTDSIHWVKSSGGRWTPENVGTACIAGIDIRPKISFILEGAPFTSITAGLSYQGQLSWLLSGDLDFAYSYRVPYFPTHVIGASLDFVWETGSLIVQAHYETTRYADTTNKMPLSPYCMLNATVNQKLGGFLTLFASARNLLNAHYESFASYYMPGISLTTGIRTAWTVDSGR
ncbi:MAG: TonB-dependent receptor [Spirochaetaceae bacterium]|jgi:vitamin B12 transporter|nr:TonB-dependent receptor [Spirochaetaceae bacterium]